MTRIDRLRAIDPALRAPALLEIDDLAISFDGDPPVRAVDGLDLTIHPRQTVALVGESGCGKSVTALSILRLVPSPPARYERGRILLDGRDVLRLPDRELRRVRGGEVAMIFQEPMTSLNPVLTLGEQLVEAIWLHQGARGRRARALAAEAIREVGIARHVQMLDSYPHEISGGMCQRIMIAMAIACRPKLLLADEPTTALDVTIQAQILTLLDDLRRRLGTSMLLITHDLGVVSRLADVVCVMYAGRAVEYATAHDLFARPLHPYTRGLLASIPRLDARRARLLTVDDVVSDPAEYRKLEGYRYGIVPWWPAQPPPDEWPLARGDEDDRESTQGAAARCRLVEVEPDHWVACWCTEYVASHPVSKPDIAGCRR